MAGGGTVGAVGVVVSPAVVVVVGGAPGWARNLRSLTYGELKAMAVEAPLEDAAARLSASGLMRASGRRPGLAAPPVFSPKARTGRPVAGANASGEFTRVPSAAEAGTEAESDPDRASLKPIVEPATTASSSQQAVRRGTR